MFRSSYPRVFRNACSSMCRAPLPVEGCACRWVHGYNSYILTITMRTVRVCVCKHEEEGALMHGKHGQQPRCVHATTCRSAVHAAKQQLAKRDLYKSQWEQIRKKHSWWELGF